MLSLVGEGGLQVCPNIRRMEPSLAFPTYITHSNYAEMLLRTETSKLGYVCPLSMGVVLFLSLYEGTG